MVQCLSPDQVNQAFIANLPLISQTIKDFSLQSPSWYRDMVTPQTWPEGEGTSMTELEFQAELPATEEGFDSWASVDDPSGCGDVCAPNCSYNWTTMGGHSFRSKTIRQMTKDIKTPDFCITAIQNTRQYRQIFSKIVENLYNQINYQKEINVSQNFMNGIAKKFLVDSDGIKGNPQDPYTYRPKGTVTLSALTIGVFQFLYEVLRRSTRMQPYGFVDSMPTYAAVASPQMWSQLYKNDPTLRADYRAAAAGIPEYGRNLVEKYNFTSTIQGMFFPVSYLYPRRFRWDSNNSRWIRILPFVRGIPGSVGTYTDINPDYEDPNVAAYEEIQIHGANPYDLYYQPTATTAGEGTDFGPEPGYWDELRWVNPETRDDPARRSGFFFTTARIALSAQADVYNILVPRAPASTMVAFYPSAICPPEASECTNVLPDVECPTPMVLTLTPHLTVSGRYWVTFAAPVDAEVDDTIQLGHSNGGYVNAVVVSKNTAENTPGTAFEVTISGTLPVCDRWTTVYTGDTLGCLATVLSYAIDSADNTRLDLVLDRPVKADTAADVVTLTYGDGTTVSATVVSVNMLTNVWKVDIGSSAYVDNVGGVTQLCVPTATDSSCPACGELVTTSQCS